MIMDLQELFSGVVASDGSRTGQAVTATALSTNVLDLRQSATLVLADEGLSGIEMWLYVAVLVAFATTVTMTMTLESANDTGITTNIKVHFSTTAIPVASLIAGFVIARIQLPSDDYRRYMAIRYTMATAATAGTVVAFLTPDIQRSLNYPSGFTLDV